MFFFLRLFSDRVLVRRRFSVCECEYTCSFIYESYLLLMISCLDFEAGQCRRGAEEGGGGGGRGGGGVLFSLCHPRLASSPLRAKIVLVSLEVHTLEYFRCVVRES